MIKNELNCKIETDIYIANTHGYQKGKFEGRNKSGAWGRHTLTAIYKIDNQ